MNFVWPQADIVVTFGECDPSVEVGTPDVSAARGDMSGQSARANLRPVDRSEDLSAAVVPAAPAANYDQRPAFPHAAHAALLGRGGVAGVFDPHRVHRDFPARWSAYVRANYAGLLDVQLAFNVSEKTARNWWNGASGANGGHVAIAVRRHPVAAHRMLFAAE